MSKTRYGCFYPTDGEYPWMICAPTWRGRFLQDTPSEAAYILGNTLGESPDQRTKDRMKERFGDRWQEIEVRSILCDDDGEPLPPYTTADISGHTFVKDPDGERLTRCGNCGTLMLDQNAQTDAERYSTEGLVLEEMEFLEDDGGSFWGCPHCKTDAYLQDI